MGWPTPPAIIRVTIFLEDGVRTLERGRSTQNQIGPGPQILTKLPIKRRRAISVKCSTAGKTEPELAGRIANATVHAIPDRTIRSAHTRERERGELFSRIASNGWHVQLKSRFRKVQHANAAPNAGYSLDRIY